MSLKSELINYAKSNGATLTGFADTARFANAPKGHHPNDFLPDARTVISMGIKLLNRLVDWEGLLDNSEVITDEDFRREMESSHWHRRFCYEATNMRLEQLALLLSLYFEGQGYKALPFPATFNPHDSMMDKSPGFFAPFSHRHAAVRAGLGEFGFNNLVITPEFGPRVRFISVITDAELEPDPLQKNAICLGEDCLACIKACGLPKENLHAITPKESRKDGVFLDMPSVVDKPACKSKYGGKAKCLGKCISECPVGR